MTDLNPALVVLAHSRPICLGRLLASLTRADYMAAGKVTLVLSVDGGADEEVLRIAGTAEWPFGEKIVLERKERLGWREHALACGRLTREFGPIVLFEDDLYVAPGFYDFASAALEFYSTDDAIAGASLLSLAANENTPVATPFYPLDDGRDVFFAQKGIPFGWVVSGRQWELFEEWYSRSSDSHPVPPDLPPRVRSWPETSLSKRFIEYLVDQGRYVVFPRTSLSNNFGDPGTHLLARSRVFMPPMFWGRKDWRFAALQESLSVYDAFLELERNRLAGLCDFLAGSDFRVDLYGTRDLAGSDADWALTTRRPGRWERAFGQELTPHELNVIDRVPGKGAWLCRKDDLTSGIESEEEYLRRRLSFFYPALSPNERGIAELASLRAQCLEKEEQIALIKGHYDRAHEALQEQLRLREAIERQLGSFSGALRAVARAAAKRVVNRFR